MTIKKGDTIYRKDDGQPIPVISTRKLQGEVVRLYLGRPTTGRHADLHFGELGEYSGYSLTQTPELARKWADTLQERAEEQAERDAERDSARLTRLANRDRLNAPPRTTEPYYNGDESRISLTYCEQDRTGAIVEQTRHYGASIYRDSDRIVGEDGEYIHRWAAGWGVNWSALGTQSPALARAYARAILAAADLADERNASTITTPQETATP